MADLWGALAQSAPGATTLTDAYTVPPAKNATIEIIACNRAGATTIRVSHAIAGATNTNAQYLLYDFALAANGAAGTARITARAADVIRVYSTSGSVSFTVNGIEEDQ